MTGIWRLRAAVLTLVGALGVHEVRYLLAAPEHEHARAAAHEYLTWLTPAAAVLFFLAAVELGSRLARRPGGADLARLPSGRALWLAATVALLGVFAAQECLETLLAHGGLPSLAEALADGGWAVVPAAAVAGGAIALLLRGAATVIRWAASRGPRRGRTAVRPVSRPVLVVLGPRGSVLARRLAGRAPPALS